MDKTVLMTLLIAAALAMPAWMAWRQAHKRPWLGGWLLVVGLLILPYGLTFWLHPEWLAHPVPFLGKYLVLLPAFVALSTLGGGLLYLLAPLALALLLAVGNSFKNVEWRQDTSNNSDDIDESGYGWDYDPDAIKSWGSGWSDLLLPGDKDD